MASLGVPARDHLRQIQRIQAITIGWMSIEAGVSLWSAWRAKSPALLAFGGDSAIELVSAAIVLWRFRNRPGDENRERRAARIAGGLLIILAAYIVVASALMLLGFSEAQPSYIGIFVLLAAMVVMPWLARQKRHLSSVTGSAALRADAAESMLCAYLSGIALLGLGANAFFSAAWADPIAALLITPLVVWEARAAIRGQACRCC